MSDRIDPFASAVDMLAALRARRLSAVELLELHRSRIARHNPELNAVSSPTSSARAATRRRPTRSGRAARTRRSLGCR